MSWHQRSPGLQDLSSDSPVSSNEVGTWQLADFSVVTRLPECSECPPSTGAGLGLPTQLPGLPDQLGLQDMSNGEGKGNASGTSSIVEIIALGLKNISGAEEPCGPIRREGTQCF
ncbi:hypothetical protein CB1_001121001 [Camelus ferus]|nr:hypothetical protein CB1_001121001 [Camelus ferus]